jgi:Xaa-Pro aminopeptidase
VRLERLRAELKRADVRTFLVSDPVNVAYLTGFRSSNAALLVSADGALVLTDGRYIDEARALRGLAPVESVRDIPSFLGEELARLAEPPVAFEGAFVTVAAHEALARSGVELRPTRGVVEGLRARKDEAEIEAIRRAAAVTTRAYERLALEGLVGRSEAEVAWRLANVLHEEGADGVAFPTIVAAGPNAARPHHHPGEREIGEDETVIVDMGAALAGYASDCTRTFATGALPADLAEAYDVCRDAQEAALAVARAGVSAREVDAVARTRIEDAGYRVLHGLGHGVGLRVHELPRLSDTSDDTLALGQVVTVEPGVYLPDRGGVRIEDLVVVTDAEPQIVTPFTKDLVRLA